MNLHHVTELPAEGADVVRVPLLGQALCAGFPSPADDFWKERWSCPAGSCRTRPTFLWQISGESMRGAGIFDRDLACVDRSLKAGHGRIVVAVVAGQMSIKRLVIEGNRAHLAFDNPDLPAFTVEDLEEAAIWGVVRFTIRWYLVRGRLGR